MSNNNRCKVTQIL